MIQFMGNFMQGVIDPYFEEIHKRTLKMIVDQRVSLFFIFGSLCIVLGCLLVQYRPKEFMINYIFSFHEGGEMYKWWLNSSEANVYLKAYAFNITNPIEFMSGKEKMKLQEVGPFIYREINTQKEVVFNENGTVSSKPRYEAVWDPELNELDENVTLYVPNVPLLSLANKVVTDHPLLEIPTNTLIYQTNSQPLQQMTWREYGFGQENPLVSLGHTFFPSWLPLEKVGFINLINDQTGVSATLHTGTKNVESSGLVKSYNGLDHLPQWSPPCDAIENGTLGFKIKTRIKDDENFLLYFKGTCRTLPFVPTGPKENRYGIPTTLYKIDKDAFDNGARNPANSCYCRNEECLPDGLSDLSACFYGFSAILSYPHFYNADPALLEPFEGLKPEQERHETYLRANQETGIITEFSYRMQFNLKLGDLSGIRNCSRFSNMVLPILWADMEMSSLAFRSKRDLFLLLRVAPVTDFLCAYGLIIFGVYLFFYARRDLLSRSQLIPRLRMLSQDFGNAAETSRLRKESKCREMIESELIHTKFMTKSD